MNDPLSILTDPKIMRPFEFSGHDVDAGPRIGGSAPAGQNEQFLMEHTQYFGTFPLGDGAEFSVYHRFEIFGEDDQRDVIMHNNQILQPSNMIWAKVHGSSSRDKKLPHAFPGAGLILGAPVSDLDDNNPDLCERPISPENKMFGRCYVDRHAVMDDVLALEASEHLHLLQIGFEFDVEIEGFPWDPGCLNVWARNPSDAATYRFCVQQ